MMNPMVLEAKFQEFMDDLQEAAPDGIIHVDLGLLHSLGILSETTGEVETPKQPITHYFHVIETQEKITLFNDQFVVWIVPQLINEEAMTFTLVALLDTEEPQLEMVFTTSGVYNTSRVVLGVLEQSLEEICENEDLLAKLSQAQ